MKKLWIFVALGLAGLLAGAAYGQIVQGGTSTIVQGAACTGGGPCVSTVQTTPQTMVGPLKLAIPGTWTGGGSSNYCAIQGLVNGATMATWGAGNPPTQDGICGASIIPANSTNWQSDGATGMVDNYSSGSPGSGGTAGVGGYFQARAYGNAAEVWATNLVTITQAGSVGSTAQGIEIDQDNFGTASNIIGIQLDAPFWNTAPATANGFSVNKPGGTSGAKWNTAFWASNGAANYAFLVGTGNTPSSTATGSQQIGFVNGDTSGVTHLSTMNVDTNGNFKFSPFGGMNYFDGGVSTPSLSAAGTVFFQITAAFPYVGCSATYWNGAPTFDGTNVVTFPAAFTDSGGSITCTNYQGIETTQIYPSTGSIQNINLTTQFGQSGGAWTQQTSTNFTSSLPIVAPAISINGGTAITSQSSANSQVVTCPTGGTTTQVCDAAGVWITPSSSSGTVTSFAAPSGSWPTWLVPTVTNATTTPSIAVAASAIPNAALANPATTVNGTTCTLGSTCTLPAYCAGASCPNYNQNNPNFTASNVTTSGSITATSLTIPIVSTTGFTPTGCGTLATPVESFCWDSITSTTLVINNVSERGINGTTAASHGSSSLINGIYFSQAPCPTCGVSIAISAGGQVAFLSPPNPGLAGSVYLPPSTFASGSFYGSGTWTDEGALQANNLFLNAYGTATTTCSGTGCESFQETTSACTPTAGFDCLRADATTHTLKYSVNGGAEISIGSSSTATNCSSAASPAVCGSAQAGSVLIPTGTTSSTLTVNTTAVTANSQIFFYPDDTLGTRLSTTCNSTLATLAGGSFISARTAGTSFTITFNGTIATSGVCGSYEIIN